MKRPSIVSGQRTLPRWQVVGMVLAGIASISGLSYILYTAILKVASGHGLETYRTVWLVEGNWLELLVFFASLAAALVTALMVRFYQQRHWREFERRYGPGKRDA